MAGAPGLPRSHVGPPGSATNVAPRVRVHKGRETGTNQFRGFGVLPQKGNPLTGLFTVTPWAQYELVTLLDTWLPTAAASSLLHLTCLEPCAVAMAKSVISPGSMQVAYGSYIQGYSIHIYTYICLYIRT